MSEIEEFNSKIGIGKSPSFQNKQRRGDLVPTASPIEYHAIQKSGFDETACWSGGPHDFFPCQRSQRKLSPGHYSILSSPAGLFFRKNKINVDDLIHLPDSASEEVVQEIERFWKSEEHFRKFGFLWKRGILLWGPPGSGKTSTLQLLIQSIIRLGGISVSLAEESPQSCSIALIDLRKIEPVRPVIGILEDIDALADKYGEANLLSLLDGENQIDNVVYIATTNYPERLDPRFVNRPSRFDLIKKIGMPSEIARQTYLERKSDRLRKDKKELEKWVKDTDGFSVAHLKELIVAVDVFGVKYSDSINRLKTMMECQTSSVESPKIGFNNGSK